MKMLTVILCAAGRGARTRLPQNKVLHELNGMPVLCHSLSAFMPFAGEILVACRKADEARVRAILSPFPCARTVRGGATRGESVFRALKEAKGDMVLIHDAARPFVTQKIIKDCIESVKKYGSAVAAVPLSDTVAHAFKGCIADMPPRKSLYALQTPQGFFTKDILSAYEKAFGEGRGGDFTDDSGVYAAYLGKPHIIAGDVCNRKLTYAGDFMPAERVGFGVDTHAFAHQNEIDMGVARLNLNYITLGGVVIPSDRAIEAHSDGDVLAHALMDALLSAIGERDIGYHFPDSDPKYKGANSMQLLSIVMEMVRIKGFAVKNASISVLCEQPRLSPYIEGMRNNLRAALCCGDVAVAAGTNEKLGYIGEGRGITCYALVLLQSNRR